jgi:hypothetical protein
MRQLQVPRSAGCTAMVCNILGMYHCAQPERWPTVTPAAVPGVTCPFQFSRQQRERSAWYHSIRLCEGYVLHSLYVYAYSALILHSRMAQAHVPIALLLLLAAVAACSADLVMVYAVVRHGARNVLPKTANLTESGATGGPALLPQGRVQASTAGAQASLCVCHSYAAVWH